MAELKAMGTAQNVKIYTRHGASAPMFGVSFANLGKLKKQIKTDHKLAVALWESGNMDAMTLACMIGDAAQMDEATIDKWVKDSSYQIVIDYFVSNLVAPTKFAEKKMKKWINSKDEWIGRAGWSLLGDLEKMENDLSDEFFTECIATIERDIHTAKNRTREAMNSALIIIGTRNRSLEKKATAAAKRIGVVMIDHGETACKTPDAVSYIAKTWAHRKKKGK
ncbi:DNA alkylation repair protein [Calditrichota bacterium]